MTQTSKSEFFLNGLQVRTRKKQAALFGTRAQDMKLRIYV
jgi:hypothetical protein